MISNWIQYSRRVDTTNIVAKQNGWIHSQKDEQLFLCTCALGEVVTYLRKTTAFCIHRYAGTHPRIIIRMMLGFPLCENCKPWLQNRKAKFLAIFACDSEYVHIPSPACDGSFICNKMMHKFPSYTDIILHKPFMPHFKANSYYLHINSAVTKQAYQQVVLPTC